jgi:hypothetical protein
MRRVSIFLSTLLGTLVLGHAWTYETTSVLMARVAVTGNYYLIQIDPGYLLWDTSLGNRCAGGWMRLTSKDAYDLVLAIRRDKQHATRVIFSSTDTGVPLQGNPNVKTWCAVDWIEY